MPIDIREAHIVGITNGKDVEIAKKEWGSEYVLPSNGYTTKIMEIKPGFKCSLHFHRNKNETFILVQGQLHIEFYKPDSTKHTHLLTKPLSSLILPQCTPHTFSVPKDQEGPSIFLESSTEDDRNDNYRLTKSGMNV